MSAHMIAELRCDHDGCIRMHIFVSPGPLWKPPRLTDARRDARTYGWRTGIRPRKDAGPAATIDFCHEHGDDINAPGCVEVNP